jgi:hypothetical protein
MLIYEMAVAVVIFQLTKSCLRKLCKPLSPIYSFFNLLYRVVDRVRSRCRGAEPYSCAMGRVGAEQVRFSVDRCGAGHCSPSRVRTVFLCSWVLRVFLKFD